MTSGDWLSAQASTAPARLVERLRVTLSKESDSGEAPDTSEALIGAGVMLLRQLLESEGALGRAGALELLAADASVTWAMEAAAEHPASLATRSEHAMRRIMAVAS